MRAYAQSGQYHLTFWKTQNKAMRAYAQSGQYHLTFWRTQNKAMRAYAQSGQAMRAYAQSGQYHLTVESCVCLTKFRYIFSTQLKGHGYVCDFCGYV